MVMAQCGEGPGAHAAVLGIEVGYATHHLHTSMQPHSTYRVNWPSHSSTSSTWWTVGLLGRQWWPQCAALVKLHLLQLHIHLLLHHVSKAHAERKGMETPDHPDIPPPTCSAICCTNPG